MKERIMIVIKDDDLLEKSASILYDHDYLVTKASNLSDMESQINAVPQDLILIDSSVWIKERPDLLSGLEQNHSETSIIHLVPTEDHETLERISRNGIGNYLFQPVTAKEILVMVDQAVRYRELMQRYQQMRTEFLEANKNLSNKTKEFQELLAFNTNILESMNVGILTIDKNYVITTWNSKISQIIGIKGSKAIGSNLFDILPWLNMGKVSERAKAVITEGEVTELGHIKGQKQDGAEIYADYKISPIKKSDDILGAVITVDDITQKIQFRDELDRSQKYIGNLVEYATDAIISYDLDGIILTWNKGAKELFGYGSEEAIGRPVDFLVDDKDRKKINNIFQWVKKSGSVSNFEAKLITKSGSAIPVSMTFSLIRDDEGKTYGLSGIFKDLSESKKVDRQLIQSQKMVCLRSMAFGMANDINAPLGALSSNSALLMRKSQANSLPEFTGCLGRIKEDAGRIAQLAKDLLWYAKPATNVKSRVRIHDILDKSLLFASFQANMHNIEIKKAYMSHLSHIIGNSKDLIQAFVNLFSNAMAAMPDGGVITIQTESLDREALFNGQTCICIKIADTGVGIPDENLPKIFGQFFTTKPDATGNGLGLYAVHFIIEDHQGKITVESEVNNGTCFTVWLPVPTDADATRLIEKEG